MKSLLAGFMKASKSGSASVCLINLCFYKVKHEHGLHVYMRLYDSATTRIYYVLASWAEPVFRHLPHFKTIALIDMVVADIE
jgi:hypothetical protein